MLACSTSLTEDDLPNLTYPVYVTPKRDGIRMLTACRDGKCIGFSRKLIPLRNTFIQEWCNSLDSIAGLDGEIIIPGLTFNDIQSFAMSEFTIEKSWEYHVFDYHHHDLTQNLQPSGYLYRMQMLRNLINRYNPDHVHLLLPTRCNSPLQIIQEYEIALKDGCDGIIIRSPDGPYKQGRSTLKEGYALKMKPYEEAEAIIIGFEPEYENQNPQTKDHTGSAKRSSHQRNLRPKQQLGSLLCRAHTAKNPYTFKLSGCIPRNFKIEIWNNQPAYLGKTVTYKHLPTGAKDKPRTPIFKGIRYD